MASWDTKLSIGLFSGGAVVQAWTQAIKDQVVLADMVPALAAPSWNYVPLALMISAGVVWLFRQIRGPSAGTERRLSKEFLIALRRLGGDEHDASVRAHNHVQRAAPGTLEGEQIEEATRGQYQRHIRELFLPAKKLGLPVTTGAIESAVTALDQRVTRQVAWEQFNRVSSTLIDELSGEAKSGGRRWLPLGAIVLAAVLAVAFFLFKPQAPGTGAVAEYVRRLAAPETPTPYALAYWRGCYECQTKALEIGRAIKSGAFLGEPIELRAQPFPDIAPGGVLLMVKDRTKPPLSAQLVQMALKQGGFATAFDTDTWPPKEAEFTLYVGPDRKAQ